MKDFFGTPYWASSPVNFQAIKVLSLEPDKSKSGLDGVVANEVTQPLWPSRVPLKTKTSSDMFN